MSEATSSRTTEVYAVLPNPTGNAICMYLRPAGWTLPHVRLDEALWIRATDKLNRALQAELGLPVTAVYCADFRAESQEGIDEVVWIMESHGAGTLLSENARWLRRHDIAELSLAQPHLRPVIDAYFAEVASGSIPILRPPWSRPGWFRDASRWMEDELTRHGYCLVSPAEQFQSWCLSCTLRAATSTGDIYLKVAANFPLFVHEPAIVAGLAELFPDNVPVPLSIDLPRRWMLLEDFGVPLDESPSVEARSEMLRQFARIQLAAVDQISELFKMGCLDRRLSRLETQVDGLVADIDLASSLTAAELDRLQKTAPKLKAMCRELADFGIPETLNHGDLHLGNVANQDGKMLFFDWTDACITHPFLDMITVFDEPDEALRTRLRDDYLELWTGYASPRRLHEAWVLAERLAALHQAVSYQSITAHLEDAPKRAFGNVVPHYVRLAMSQER